MKLMKEIQLVDSKTAPILHVDDDKILLKVVKRFYDKSDLENEYINFDTGKKLLDHLKLIKDEEREIPLIILIDINMPGMNGFEVLKAIRSEIKFKQAPICSILSSSKHPKDIEEALSLGADTYMVKPSNAKEYLEFFNKLASR